jgi:hypothetical protein
VVGDKPTTTTRKEWEMAGKETKEPSDADTVIRAIRTAIKKHGWDLSGSTVDPTDGSIVVSARTVADEDDGA